MDSDIKNWIKGKLERRKEGETMTREEKEISEYEIDYDYDDKNLDISEEEIRENKLPKVVLNFE